MAVTMRKVLRDVASGGRDVKRVKLMLEVKLEGVADYDKVGNCLRIRGKNILKNELVKIAQFHTLELELNRPFVLRKVKFHLLGVILEETIPEVLQKQATMKSLVLAVGNHIIL